MVSSSNLSFFLLVSLGVFGISFAQELSRTSTDPCAAIANRKWMAPSEVRACFSSFKVDPVLKNNVLDVANKTLAFHTSVNYQVRAPPPYNKEVHEDLLADLTRIRQQSYESDYDLHVDISRSFGRLNDGHCVWINNCYDCMFLDHRMIKSLTPDLGLAAFINYLPIPIVLLSDSHGNQNIHIAPEAFDVASVEFPDQIAFWKDATAGKLESLSGAKVLLINDRPPFQAVNDNAQIAGGFQGFGTRQNGFFSSYGLGIEGWNYHLGQFAQQSLPLSDSVKLLVQKVNCKETEVIVVPYRSRIGPGIGPFIDGPSYFARNCRAYALTNGELNDASALSLEPSIAAKFQQQPMIPAVVARKHALNVAFDSSPLSNISLPTFLTPDLSTGTGTRGIAQFYFLKDGKTGVLALGSFADIPYFYFLDSLRQGLVSLKSRGATRLIVDVTNNGGGFICAAHWLHRIIVGPKSTTVPLAGLYTTTRDGPLAQKITHAITANTSLDPYGDLLYSPLRWTNANNEPFNATDDWLQPPVQKVINGREDAFSQRLGQECPPKFAFPPFVPDAALFNAAKVIIVSNGRCASSCALFSITMAKYEGARTVVVGGEKGVSQQYCGIVGGQSLDFSSINYEIRSADLKQDPLAPPDLLVNGIMGITWRLGFGIDNPQEPEEWQNHQADFHLPLTKATVNNPVAIWEEVARRYFR